MLKQAILLFVLIFCTNAQYHYVPAQILIPTLNLSSIHVAPNGTYNVPVGWVPPSINNNYNTTWNQTNNNFNRTGWNNPALNRTYYNNNGTTVNGDLIVGTIGNADRLLFNQIYYKEGRWWSSREKEIEYPRDLPGGYGRHETISAIRAYNKFYDGIGAKAKLIGGGVGFRYVKIQLKSPWGKGFKYLVQIFGH